VFIGSSSQGFTDVAATLVDLLKESTEVPLEVRPWTESFLVSETNIGALENAMKHADFAVLVLTADDVVISPKPGGSTQSKKKAPVPRDNVLFELGLFMGRLGRGHCYYVREKGAALRLPSDLLGVIPAEYELPAGIDRTTSDGREAMRAALQAARAQIVARIADVASARGMRRLKVPEEEQEALEDAHVFSREIEGCWWSLRDWDPDSVGHVDIWLPEGSFTPRVRGQIFERSGRRAGRWDSVASCVLPREGKLYYYFTGHHLDERGRPAEQYQGFTEYAFDSRTHPPEDGLGIFSDRNLAETLGREPKSLRLRRCTPPEIVEMKEAMARQDDERVATLLATVLPHPRR
jgi:hypothetical protein